MNYFGITDRGMVRKNNQDSFCCEDIRLIDSVLLVVCDGMGGAKGGNIASSMTIDIFKSEIIENINVFGDADETLQLMKKAAEKANAAVLERSITDSECNGMGTTLVAAIVSNQGAAVINVGDSRAYLISRTDGIAQITRDHSFVEDLVRRGDITKEQARCHPNKNIITRAIGTTENILVDTFYVSLRESDRVLLCSDGLSNAVDDDQLYREVLKTDDMTVGCEELLKAAIAAGAPDNVTAALIRI